MTSQDSLATRSTAAVLLVACFLAFFSRPLFLEREGYYSAADLTQRFALTDQGQGHEPANQLLGDTVTQMQPWLEFNRQELAAGRFPLWNPYNSNGLPHFANYQSAVLSPFSLPFYVLPFKAALLVAAIAKLAVTALFTWLFLKELGLGAMGRALGAILFTFSGYQVLLLAYPHSGAVAWMPAALWLVERCRARCLARGLAHAVPTLVALALCTAAIVFAGHPEAAAWVLLFVGAWIATRVVGLWRAKEPSFAGLGLALSVALALGLGIGAVQIVPFVEYLLHSTTLTYTQRLAVTPLQEQWPLLFFPNALGTPLPHQLIADGLPAPNYEESTTHFVAGVGLALAFVALFQTRQERRARFFIAVMLLWILGSVLPQNWRDSSLVFRLLPFHRVQLGWCFAVACAAAITLDRLLAAPPKEGAKGAERRMLLVLALGWCLAWWGATVQLDHARVGLDPTNRATAFATADAHVRNVFSAGWVAFALGWLVVEARRATPRWAAAGLLCVLAFAPMGWWMRDYNPTTRPEFVWPRTEAMEVLRRTVGDRQMLVLGDNGLPPHTNMAYGLYTPAAYDALTPARHDYLYTFGFSSLGNWHHAQKAHPATLKIFGLEHVLGPGDWPPVGTALARHLRAREHRFQPIRLNPSDRLIQRFTCEGAGLRRVAVFVSTPDESETKSSDLRLRLHDEEGRLLSTRDYQPPELRSGTFAKRDWALDPDTFAAFRPWHGRMMILEVPRQADSRGKSYHLSVDCQASSPDDRTSVWTASTLRCLGAELKHGGERLEHRRMLLFDYETDASRLSFEARAGPFGVFRVADSLGQAFAVQRTMEVDGDTQALHWLCSASFDPYALAILSPIEDIALFSQKRPEPLRELGEVLATRDEAFFEREKELGTLPADALRARTLERTSLCWKLTVDCPQPRWLVLCQTWFPGWKARVDGVERPLRRANFAFSAVEVPAGACEVELSYEPRSFSVGLWTSAASLIGLLVGAWMLARRSTASKGGLR